MASQITRLSVVYSTVYLGADQRKHQSSAPLAFVWGIHRGPVNSPPKGPATLKMFPFDDVIMICTWLCCDCFVVVVSLILTGFPPCIYSYSSGVASLELADSNSSVLFLKRYINISWAYHVTFFQYLMRWLAEKPTLSSYSPRTFFHIGLSGRRGIVVSCVSVSLPVNFTLPA